METLHNTETCSKTPAVLRDAFSWALARLTQTFIAAQNAALEELGLTMRSFAVLATVSERAARTQLEIAQVVGLDKSTLVSTIDELEKRGLVERRADPADRRARVVESTPAGRKLGARGAEIVAGTEAKLLGGFNPSEASRLKSSVIDLLLGALREDPNRPGSCI
ncbi:MAG: MarR family transcriptional regulator [Candidatus Eremiobacteraeota bacterium]|nr:MarR family transcriptional regulator [Candidatus Eremiobacteraeota bacterium]